MSENDIVILECNTKYTDSTWNEKQEQNLIAFAKENNFFLMDFDRKFVS